MAFGHPDEDMRAPPRAFGRDSVRVGPVDPDAAREPSGLEPRRDRYSALVRVLRIGLPLAAVGLLVLGLYGAQRDGGGEFVFQSGQYAALHSGMRLTNPRFTGTTSDGAEFLLRADWAEPDSPDPTEIALGPLFGEIELSPGEMLRLEAANGLFLPRDNHVSLSDGVRVITSDGYVLTTESLRADAENRVIESDGAVAGVGPMGEATAGRLRATDADGGALWLDGGVTARIVDLVESKADGR